MKIKKITYLCSRFGRKVDLKIAKIAQLVEHDLAKVGVAGSSPVFRSTEKLVRFSTGREVYPDYYREVPFFAQQMSIPPGWWNGRHEGLKILWLHGCAGSSPASGTQQPR